MFIYCLFLLVESALWSVSSVDIGLAGEVGFDLRPARAWSPRGRAPAHAQAPPGLRLRLRLDSKSEAPSAAPACIYQLPKTKHVNAIMSNMMNVLTKIFTRSRELCGAGPRHRVRVRNSRFRIVGATQSAYFDQIYSNMTQEFNKSFVSDSLARQRAGGSGDAGDAGDACAPQAEARRQWRELLARAHDGLHRAAASLIHHHLKAAGCSRAPALASKLASKLGALLSRELRRLRARQLAALCQRRPQCYAGLS